MATPNPFMEMLHGMQQDDELLDQQTPAVEPEPLPEAAPPPAENPFMEMLGEVQREPVPAPVPEELGTFENLWAGLKERGSSLIGDLAGGVETLGQRAETDITGLGGIVHHGGLDFDYLTPEEWAKYTEEGGRMGLEEIQEDWKNASYGFTSNSEENWEKLKNHPELWEKMQAAASFALEVGTISLADMAGAVIAPPAYIVARTEEIAQERAVNQGRPGNPSNDDLKIAFGTAVIIQAMERFGFDRIADAFTKGGSALQKITTAGLAEAGTEGVQEPLEFLAETYGTPTEEAMTPEEYRLAAAERGAQGMLGGGPTGAVLATPGALLGPRDETISPDVKDLDENRHAITRALNEQAMQMEQDQVIQDEREMLEAEQQAAEMAIQREADEIDAQEGTYKSAAHAELKLQQLEKKYGETRLDYAQSPEGEWIIGPRGRTSMYRVAQERAERLGVGQRPAEEGRIEVAEVEQVVATEPAPTPEGIEVGEEIIATEPAPTTEGLEVPEIPPDLYVEPTRAPIGVTELTPEEVEITEPVPTEGIEVEEVVPEEVGEAIPQIGVEEVTEGEEEITIGRKIYHRPPKKEAEPEVVEEAGPIMPRIISGEISQGRRARPGIEAEIADVEAQLSEIPSNIQIMEEGGDALMTQAHRLRIQRRDLIDEQKYRIKPEEARQARTELWERLRQAGESVNRYETIDEMRARLGRLAQRRQIEERRQAIAERPVVFQQQENLGSGTEAFIDELPSVAPMEEDTYTYRGTKIELEPDGENQIRVANIEAERMREGAGTRAMTILTEMADKHGVDISLEPVSFAIGGGAMTNEQLENWYRRFGFEFDPEYENTMIRRAGAEAVVEAEPDTTPVVEPETAVEHPQVPGRMDTDTLPDGSTYDLSKSAETQIATTVGTYDKVNEEYFSNIDNAEMLDYGAGKGLAAQKHGFESLEPYPRGWTPTYQNTYRIRRQYDGIIMNNILNVLPKHTRRAVLWDAAEKMRPGSRMYINVRSRSDVMGTTVIQKKFNDSEILTGRGTYQKGFQPQELINFIQAELGPDYTVEKAKFGSVSVIVTKSSKMPTEEPGPTRPEAAAAALAETEVEGREATDEQAQIAAFNFIDSNPAFVGTRLSHGPGDVRFGTTLPHYYGDQDNTEGADGDPVDVILSADFEPGREYPIFIANLVDQKTGDFEQHKVMAGFDSQRAAEDAVEEMYPGQLEFVAKVSPEDYTSWRNSPRTRDVFDPETFKTQIEKGQDLRKPAKTDTAQDPVKLASTEAGPIDYSPWLLADGSIVEGGGDHMAYLISRGVEAEDAQDLRAVSAMQLEGGGVRSAFFYDPTENTSVAYLHLHDDQALTDEQIATVEAFTKAARKAGRKAQIIVGSTPTYDPVNKPEEFLPVVKKSSLAALKRDWGARKRKYRADMEQFYAGLADKSAKYSKAAVGRLQGQLKPDPTQDDIITFLRKHGGLNVNLGGDWRGRLSHLNANFRLPGLPGIEQTNGTGLSMDQAAEIAWEGNYIREYDADLLADLLEAAEDGRQIYSDQNQTWMEEQWAEQQAEAEAEYEARAQAEAQDWAEGLGDEFSAVDTEMAELMARAALLDENMAEMIAESPNSDEDVKQALRNFINEWEQATTETGRPPAEEVVEPDEGVEAEARAEARAEPVREGREEPTEEPAAGDYDSISEFPWQDFAQFHGVEILEPPSPDIEGPRTFVIDVYSDLQRTNFVRRVYAANYFRLRDVESAFLGRMGPYRGRLQERDEFIEIQKISYEDQDGHHSLIDEIKSGNQNKPYWKLEPIKRIEDKRAGARKKERQRREAGWLTPEQWSATVERYNDELMAEPDPRDVVNHSLEENKAKGKPRDYISHEEGRKKIDEWEAHAESIGNLPDTGNNQRVILSLFDDSGEWAQPWIDAGYDVRAIDLKRDDVDIMDIDYGWLLDNGFLEGPGVWGILAACPCTTFATPAARDWKPGPKARPKNEGGMDFIGKTHSSVDLVNQTLTIIEFLKPRFWALENPVGRIRKITGVPDPRLTFNPSNYGDPYTKKTQIFGNFNPNLPTAKVDPRKEFGGEGSRAHNLSGKDELDGGLRSVTPKGFAYAFFMANNDQDNPVADEIVRTEFVRTIPDEVKEKDPNIERKVELVAKLALLSGTYPNQRDLADGTVTDYHSGSYYLEETDNWPKWAKALINDINDAARDDWRIDDGNVATVRELRHLDQEIRELLGTGQKKTTRYPQKEAIDPGSVETLPELQGPYAEENFDIIDPYMMEGAVDAVNTAIADLAQEGYTWAELMGEPSMELPNSLRDPVKVIRDVASGAIPVAKALRAVRKGDRRMKPANALDRLYHWNTVLENALGQQAMTGEQFKEHVYEEYPFLANALDASYDDGDDGGMAMRRQRPDPVTIQAEFAESMGRDDLAWGPAPEPPPMPAEEGPPVPVPPKGEPSPEAQWEPVPEPERPPEVDVDVILNASAEGEGVSLSNIPLTATDGDRSVTHNAKWWKDAIDDRLIKLNRLRGCA